MKYYIIVGEASGDLHASNLMKEIKARDTEAVFRFWGGDKMLAQGGEIVKHYRDLAFMGFTEVLVNLKTILRNIKLCKENILGFDPDVLILVDYPGFNLRIAEFAREKGLKVIYYISPQVWAWKKGRVKKIRKVVDKMYVILPFEKEFYKSFDYDVDFVGHPLLDVLEDFPFAEKDDFTIRNKLDGRPVIALLPGSRKQEISKMLKVMLTMIPVFSDYQFVIGMAPSVDESFYNKITASYDVKLMVGQTYDLLKNADAAMVTSGTATLETALIGTPEIVCYKGGAISYQIAKRLVDVKYISLVNLIMDREIVQELIQTKLNAENLKNELNILLFDRQYREAMLKNYRELREKLGGSGASAKTAELIQNFLNH